MTHTFPGLFLQKDPPIVTATIPGRWLLERTTPSWRIENPRTGFQRRVSSVRAQEIATAVLDQGRTFPNAIVLATDTLEAPVESCVIVFPEHVRFLVVDGQHRLWAQNFSGNDASYSCIVHLGLTEREMAKLFIEINDNQKRVPSSLRWDLVRLVRSEDDPSGVRAVDLVFELNSTKNSPLYQRVDLTGEQHEITIKQGSLAPDIRRLVGLRSGALRELEYDSQLDVLKKYFSAIRECDADGWDNANGYLYKARVLRALLRLLPDIVAVEERKIREIGMLDYLIYLRRIDPKSLDPERIRGQQGRAGIKAIYDTIRSQIGA
ncbi:MAG: DGQHR domain-containing protein [Gammaproteobacteria bacterium]|nr:DGQHR domain-containing protein [Gammaproteobacteria bacterium]